MFKCFIENVIFIILVSWSSEAHFGGHNIHKVGIRTQILDRIGGYNIHKV